jgi:acyl carrier protein
MTAMAGSRNEALKLELKQLIVAVCNKEIAPESITDDEPLIGVEAALGLDSLDVLQINTAIMQRWGVRIEDGKHARRVMKSINALADFVSP